MKIEERGSTHVYRQIRMLSEEELRLRESRCIHDEPARCVAACPLKLDTRAMLAAAAKGDFDGARKLYEKIAPLPYLLSAGCDAPCEGACLLRDSGDGIAVRALEQAVMSLGQRAPKGLARMKKRKTAAIFGSGLFVLFLAGELNKKAYPVTVFCAEPDLETFFAHGTDFAPAEAVAAELAQIRRSDIRFAFSSELTPEYIHAQRAGFDVICAEWETLRCLLPSIDADPSLMYDRAHGLVTGETHGVMDAAFAAKRASLTVDRLAQGLDPASSRGIEGPVETRLVVDQAQIRPSRRVPVPPEGYDRESAMKEAERCIQCSCDACMRACAYLRHYGKSPKVLTREIYNNVSIIMGDHMMNRPINACALCGQCKFVCPNGYDLSEICHLARENMVSTDKMPLAPHEFALLDMIFSNEEAFLARPQPGFERCRYVFFPGCQAAAVAPGVVKAAYADLCGRLEGGVALMLACCGAICDWAGRYELRDRTRDFLNGELSRLGDPVIIAGCPTCAKELRAKSGHVVTGVWDVLLSIGLPEGAAASGRPAALHDACGARGDTETQNAVRALAGMLGRTLKDVAEDRDGAPCCGYGGLASYASPEVAGEMTEHCLSREEGSWITYCMACRDRFARAGRESRHLLELVYGTDAGAPPDISEKRRNRRNLKRELLRKYWQEEIPVMEMGFVLEYTQDARKMMDERMILTEDVEQVVQSLRETGEAVLDGETGLLIARRRIGSTTFWVKLTETAPDHYLVCGAYSHRMNIVRRQ